MSLRHFNNNNEIKSKFISERIITTWTTISQVHHTIIGRNHHLLLRQWKLTDLTKCFCCSCMSSQLSCCSLTNEFTSSNFNHDSEGWMATRIHWRLSIVTLQRKHEKNEDWLYNLDSKDRKGKKFFGEAQTCWSYFERWGLGYIVIGGRGGPQGISPQWLGGRICNIQIKILWCWHQLQWWRRHLHLSPLSESYLIKMWPEITIGWKIVKMSGRRTYWGQVIG